MSAKNIHILTRDTLDGIGSILLLGWAYPDAEISYSIFGMPNAFRGKFNNKNLKKYDIVFATDLIINAADIPLIDKSNVILVDRYNLNTISCRKITATNSCTYTLFKILKDKLDITTSQKEIVVYVEDYTSYTNNFVKSYDLNILLKNIGASAFVQLYADGLKNFTQEQKAVINLYKRDVQQYISKLSFFEATLNISQSSKPVQFVGSFANKFINEIADNAFKTFPECEVCFVVNLESKKVSFRRKSKSSIKLDSIAKTLCDGYGHEYASGGTVTDKFLSFTKSFKSIDAN